METKLELFRRTARQRGRWADRQCGRLAALRRFGCPLESRELETEDDDDTCVILKRQSLKSFEFELLPEGKQAFVKPLRH